MTLRLAGGGRFGSLRRPQVAWAGLDGDVGPLVDARRPAGRRRPRALRLPVEDRPFRPHLTLGRWRPGQPADGALTDRLAGYRGPAWPVTEVRLLESHLGPSRTYDDGRRLARRPTRAGGLPPIVARRWPRHGPHQAYSMGAAL